jgi:DNA-binding transcriptional regulator YdaS (Cro superfamily)
MYQMKNKYLLRSWRKKKNLSAKQLADVLQISEVSVRSLENGWRNVTAERAKQIERVSKGAIKREQLRPDIFS